MQIQVEEKEDDTEESSSKQGCAHAGHILRGQQCMQGILSLEGFACVGARSEPHIGTGPCVAAFECSYKRAQVLPVEPLP